MNKENNSNFTNATITTKIKNTCSIHNKPIGCNFCTDCLSYLVCTSCIPESHCGHEVMGFSDIEQAKDSTRQILLQTLEETLKSLKRRENQTKNKSAELDLLKNNLKSLQSQMLREISEIFKTLEDQLQESIKAEERKLEVEMQKFYMQYNQINDELRDHLLKIINNEMDIFTFRKEDIIIQPPSCPEFQKPKQCFQKQRKIYRNIQQNLTIIQGLLTATKMNNGKQSQSIIASRLDKYLQNSKTSDKVNQSFMKTMNIIMKQNIPLNLSRVQRK